MSIAKYCNLINPKSGTPITWISSALAGKSLLACLLSSAFWASAQGISGIGAFVPNTELGFTPIAKAGEPRINWI
ncbi:MAG: hypothetical protein LBE58_09410, partial [Comamonas sp.]|nr:hypothetical protein [Comamonas sp.]